MVYRAGLLLILVSSLSAPAHATELRQLTLTDGSVISGEIESVQGGVYTVRSPSLGTIKLKDSDIRSIVRSNGSPTRPDATPTGSGAPGNPQIDALQRKILDDDTVMSSVSALQDDPQFQDVLKDPEIRDALGAGDLEALERNPKFRNLMDNPKLQEINKQLAR